MLIKYYLACFNKNESKLLPQKTWIILRRFKY